MARSPIQLAETFASFEPCCLASLREVCDGYAARRLQAFLQMSDLECRELASRAKGGVYDGLLPPEWRRLHHVIATVACELGPEELHTVTAFQLFEMMNAARVCFQRSFDETPTDGWTSNG